MLAVAAGSDVEIGLVAQDPRGLYGIVLIVLGELLQAVEGLLVDQIALLDPTLHAGARANARESLFAIEYLHPLSVLHGANTVVYGCDLVAERCLRADT